MRGSCLKLQLRVCTKTSSLSLHISWRSEKQLLNKARNQLKDAHFDYHYFGLHTFHSVKAFYLRLLTITACSYCLHGCFCSLNERWEMMQTPQHHFTDRDSQVEVLLTHFTLQAGGTGVCSGHNGLAHTHTHTHRTRGLLRIGSRALGFWGP